jgi:DDE superfamily endonuclease
LACELPAEHGVALSLWDCTELARRLEAEGLVDHISAETVRRVLTANALKPWRCHSWLSAKVPRDAAFAAAISVISDLYTRPLAAHEVVLCMDEKTSIQPRQRLAPTRPAAAGRPVQVEQEYKREGALNLFAAFDTRKGDVIGWNAERKRAQECVAFLDLLDARLPQEITVVHLVLDNLGVHKSKAVTAWLALHPRFLFHFPPIHCSWMNQIEQWFSVLQRKALRCVNFTGLLALDRHLHRFIEHWNSFAHPFNWTSKSITKVMAKCATTESLPDAA